MPSSHRFFTLLALFLLSCAVLMAYAGTFDASWHFDDTHNILDKEAIHLEEWSWDQVREAFFEGRRLYRPVSNLTFALNYAIGGRDVTSYHVVNTVVHILASVFLFLFVRLTLLRSRIAPLPANQASAAALLAALLWAVHPIQTQAVTYIVQRMTSLAGMFFVLAMYFFARARLGDNRKGLFWILCVLSWLLAMGSKENAVTLPLVLGLYELLLVRTRPIRAWLARHWKALALLGLFTAVLVLGFLDAVQSGGPLGYVQKGYRFRLFTLEERLLTETRIVVFYISLLLLPLPSRLSIVHDIPLSHSLTDPVTTLLAAGFILCSLLAAVFTAEKHPLTSFCIFFFFLNHVVESTILPLELVFEHRNYLPSMLFFVPPALWMVRGAVRPSFSPWTRRLVVLFAALLVGVFVAASHARNRVWKDEITLWQDAAQKAPHTWRPFHNLGSAYTRAGKHEKALSLFRLALTKERTSVVKEKHLTFNAMAEVYRERGELEKALASYRKAEHIFDGLAEHTVNKGVVLMNLGRPTEASTAFRRALELDSNLAAAHSNLGLILFKSGSPEEGLRHLQQAVRLDPEDLVTLKRLAYVHLRTGSPDKALQLFQRYRALRPEDLSALLYMAEIHAREGRPKRAEESLEHVLHIVGRERLTDLFQDEAFWEASVLSLPPDRNMLTPVLQEILGTVPRP